MAAKRVQELQVEYLDGEALVYNPHRSEATALNDVAAAVFNVCDGEHDIDAMIAHLDSVGLGPSSADIVGLALRDLAAADLIEVDADLPDTASRRDMLKKLVGAAAGATVLLPIVETIAAPAAAAAASYPTPAPFASPTPAPFASPTPAPFASPTPAPFASPTPAPFASPTPAPFASPTPAPFVVIESK